MKLKTKERLFFTVIAVLLLSGAYGIYALFRSPEIVAFDPKAKPEEAMAFVASDKFAKMPMDKQREYLSAMRESRRSQPRAEGEDRRQPMADLSEAQRKTMRDNMRRVREVEINERLDKFFAMSKEEQLAELDKRIEERKKFLAENPNRRRGPGGRDNAQGSGGGNNNRQNPGAANTTAQTGGANSNNAQQPGGGNNNRTPPSAQDRREHYEEMSPATRAKMRAYGTMQRLRSEGKL